MFRSIVLCLFLSAIAFGYPSFYLTKNFKVGIEYDPRYQDIMVSIDLNSLPMNGGSDRYRHRNNYDPFFVTVTATAKTGYVISYLEVSATVDSSGEVDFNLIRGQTGSRSMVFQLVSNHSDFLAYTYLAYGIREEEYKKIANIVTLPIARGSMCNSIGVTILLLISSAVRFVIL